ncbi:MAG: MATE family efflux transporter [Lachnospiraceae bacterium]|nr:MATE family efflux transporter [Lachnospiraceae bacterium]
MEKKNRIVQNLIYLSIPTMLEQILSTLLQYVDTAMVGHLGEEATAAVSVTTTIGWLVGSLMNALGIALLSLMSQAVGRGDHGEIKKMASQAVYLVIGIGVLLGSISLILAPYIPVWMGAAESVQGPATTYFTIISLPMIFRAATLIFGATIRANLDTKTPMFVNLIANVINVVLDLFLIYGVGLGVTGAAIATAVTHIFAGSAMFIVFRRKKELHFSWKEARFDTGVMKKIGRIAIPSIGADLTATLGYVFFAGMVSGMGTTTFAAHSIAVEAETLFYIPGYGLRTATSAMTGVSIGEDNASKLRTVMKASILMTVGLMAMSGIVLYFVSYPLMRVFTSSVEVATLGAQMLKIVAFSEPFFGLMVVCQGLFYGMGRTKNVFLVEAFSMWGIRIMFTYLVVNVWYLGLRQVWYCMIADNICKATLLAISLIIVWKKGKWRNGNRN